MDTPADMRRRVVQHVLQQSERDFWVLELRILYKLTNRALLKFYLDFEQNYKSLSFYLSFNLLPNHGYNMYKYCHKL